MGVGTEINGDEPMEELEQAKLLLEEHGMLDTINGIPVEDSEAEAKFARHTEAGTALTTIKTTIERIQEGTKKECRENTKHIALAFRFLKLKTNSQCFRELVRLTPWQPTCFDSTYTHTHHQSRKEQAKPSPMVRS